MLYFYYIKAKDPQALKRTLDSLDNPEVMKEVSHTIFFLKNS